MTKYAWAKTGEYLAIFLKWYYPIFKSCIQSGEILPLKLFQGGIVLFYGYTSRDKQNDKSSNILSSFWKKKTKQNKKGMIFFVFIQVVEQQRVNWKVLRKIPHGDQHFAFGPRLSSRDKLVCSWNWFGFGCYFYTTIWRLPYRVLFVMTNGFSSN